MIIIPFLFLSSVFNKITTKQIDRFVDNTPLLYGSIVRIKGIGSSYFLHSHDITITTGHQSVTGFSKQQDYNSLWILKGKHGSVQKSIYDKIKCGEIIRLQHSLTKKNLHSDNLKSYLTGQQEAVAFGNNGFGDQGDDWILQCIYDKPGKIVNGKTQFSLKHKLTNKYLRLSRSFKFTHQNCGMRCPMLDQIEPDCISQQNFDTKFKIVGVKIDYQGMFVMQQLKKQENENGEQQFVQTQKDKQNTDL